MTRYKSRNTVVVGVFVLISVFKWFQNFRRTIDVEHFGYPVDTPTSKIFTTIHYLMMSDRTFTVQQAYLVNEYIIHVPIFEHEKPVSNMCVSLVDVSGRLLSFPKPQNKMLVENLLQRTLGIMLVERMLKEDELQWSWKKYHIPRPSKTYEFFYTIKTKSGDLRDRIGSSEK